ncbi:hypothetical protein ROA7450_04172 [Roseovarius albus]|uniref:Uncharacterized protein n=2 Tax=Roseovarius albus TaxID=1247867 RepID=A0A1X7A9B9_9RHOB|nr:hypothetical protein ROA7450_04172 [Roseovarius albus]
MGEMSRRILMGTMLSAIAVGPAAAESLAEKIGNRQIPRDVAATFKVTTVDVSWGDFEAGEGSLDTQNYDPVSNYLSLNEQSQYIDSTQYFSQGILSGANISGVTPVHIDLRLRGFAGQNLLGKSGQFLVSNVRVFDSLTNEQLGRTRLIFGGAIQTSIVTLEDVPKVRIGEHVISRPVDSSVRIEGLSYAVATELAVFLYGPSGLKQGEENFQP